MEFRLRGQEPYVEQTRRELLGKTVSLQMYWRGVHFPLWAVVQEVTDDGWVYAVQRPPATFKFRYATNAAHALASFVVLEDVHENAG